MKLIDADKLKKEFVKACGAVPYVEGRKGEPIYVDKLIDEQPQIEQCGECSRRKWYQKGYEDAKQEKWIRVSERLPEDYKLYLGLSKTGEYYGYSLVHLHEGKLVATFGDDPRCIAWMPLPEPYKEDAECK